MARLTVASSAARRATRNALKAQIRRIYRLLEGHREEDLARITLEELQDILTSLQHVAAIVRTAEIRTFASEKP